MDRTRRRFIQQTLAVSGAALVTLPGGVPTAAEASAAASLVLDTHTHFYDPTRPEGVPWPPPKSPLYRRVLPPDWQAVAAPLGVTSTVVVEASPRVEDNAWLLELATRHPCIVGVVGNLDPLDPSFDQHLKRFSASPHFRGIRISSKALLEKAEDPAFLQAMHGLADRALTLDVNGPPTILEPTAKLARKFPSLRIVLDHLGSPGDPRDPMKEPWRQGMKAVGACSNVSCKVSALREQHRDGSQQGDVVADLYRPYLDWTWNCFGEDRLIFGSNWPVSERGGSYAQLLNLVRGYFSGKGAEVERKFFFKNGQQAYALA